MKNVKRQTKQKMPSHNEQFCESGGVYPPKHLCEFASAPPAQAFVSPRPRKAATTLSASGVQRSESMTTTKYKKITK